MASFLGEGARLRSILDSEGLHQSMGAEREFARYPSAHSWRQERFRGEFRAPNLPVTRRAYILSRTTAIDRYHDW